MVLLSKSGVCIRWTTFIAGCFIWLGGSIMLGLGIWVTTQDTDYKHLTGDLCVTIVYIAVSSFIFIVGFIGVCSILLFKRKLLKLYFALLLILCLTEIVGAVYLYLQRDQIEEYIRKNWNAANDQTRILIQNKLLCCSMKPLIKSHQSSNDKSCFKDENTSGERLEDCYSSLKNWMKTNYLLLATSAAVVAAIQMVALGGVCRMIVNMDSSDRMIRRVSVAPFNGNAKSDLSKRTRREADQVLPSENNSSEDLKREELPVKTRRNSLDCWAKNLPKYAHKL